jgi:hypothetical protein
MKQMVLVLMPHCAGVSGTFRVVADIQYQNETYTLFNKTAITDFVCIREQNNNLRPNKNYKKK